MKIEASKAVKLHSVKQLRKFQANTRTKQGEAYIAITKTADNKVSIGWKGTKKDLVNLLYTTAKNDRGMAAIICQVAKDHVDTRKHSTQSWGELTADIIALQNELTNDQHQEGGQHEAERDSD
ncbi:MAG: hypothetical protein [Bacteriophage sp.]|jgi:hypothetical protein|nr:MAG: hypothetical protein [Bacteriophage sp.]